MKLGRAIGVGGAKVAVLGMGRSGMAAARLLRARGAGHVVVRDSKRNEQMEARAEQLRALGISVQLGEDSFTHECFDLAVLSPGIDPRGKIVSEIRTRGGRMVGEVELAWWFCERPLIAVTGTNGKSTTTELIAAALHAGGVSAVACGNLGTPFSDIVLENRQERYIVLEISSFQLEGIETFKPYVAVYLNFAADHMDRYDSLDAYRQAKERIFFNQTPREHAIVNARCEMGATRARKKTFDAMGGDADYAFRHGYLYACGHAVLEQSRTRLSGPHNAENQMAALAAADICGVGRDAVIRALCEYRPLPHRCEIVRTHHGVVYIDDSKATNLHAMENALLGQNRPVILIAGGKDKGLPLEPLCDVVKEKARLVLLIGEAKERFMRAWEHATECRLCGSLQEAVKSASLMAREGDVVLLSPGCSSYDMFRDFEERGEVFRREVERL